MTTWRTAASHQGAPLLVAFLVGPEQHARLVEALPGWSIVTTAQNGLGVRPSDVAAIAMMHGAIGIVLAGHSAGVQGVRALAIDLDTGGGGFPLLPHTTVPLLGVLATDGTSAAYPSPLPWQIETWRKVAALARARRIVAVFTCSQMSYVETLPSPFMATRHVLARALGVDLLADVELHDGALHARGYPSPTGATKEAEAAHNRQLSQVFPAMLRDFVFPFVGGGIERPDERAARPTLAPTIEAPKQEEPRVLRRGMSGPDVAAWQAKLVASGFRVVVDGQFGPRTQAATCELQASRGLVPIDGAAGAATRAALNISSPDPQPPKPAVLPSVEVEKEEVPHRLAAAVLAVAREDLALNIREITPNDSPEIRRLYLDPMKLPPGVKWCAPAVTSWVRRGAERAGVPMPIAGSPAAKAIRDQLVATGRWVPRAKLEGCIAPGWILVWDRSIAGRPETAWWGHTGILNDVNGRAAQVIEGNSGVAGDRLAMMPRSLDDPRLLGAGLVGSSVALLR